MSDAVHDPDLAPPVECRWWYATCAFSMTVVAAQNDTDAKHLAVGRFRDAGIVGQHIHPHVRVRLATNADIERIHAIYENMREVDDLLASRQTSLLPGGNA